MTRKTSLPYFTVLPALFLLGLSILPIEAKAQIILPENTQTENAPDTEFDIYDDKDEVVATGVRQSSFSETRNVSSDFSFRGRDILALGASDIGELIDAINAESQSTSDEPPIYLLNGRPVSSKKEIRRFPSESVRRVEILPPEAALKFTSDSSRRVINFILRRRFKAITSKIQGSTTTDGGRTYGSLSVDRLRIKNKTRLAFNVGYEKADNLTRAQREIPARVTSLPFSLGGTITAPTLNDEIDPVFSALVGENVSIASVPDTARFGVVTLGDFVDSANTSPNVNPQVFQDLKPQTEVISLGGTFFRPLGESLSASGSIQTEFSSSVSQGGLIGSRFTIGQDNPFSPFDHPIALFRYDGPIARENQKDDIEVNLALFGDYQDWRWSLEGQYSDISNARVNARKIETTLTQQGLDLNDPSLNPFGNLHVLDNVHSYRAERSLILKAGLSGKVLKLPAGDVTGSARLEYVDANLNSIVVNSNNDLENQINRQALQVSSEMNIPLLGKRGAPRSAGKLSLRLNGALRAVDGFDMLAVYGTGLNWNVTDNLKLQGGLDYRERAPQLTQLGNPALIDSNIRVTDFETGAPVFIDRITGGNPNLSTENRRSIQLTVRYRASRNFSLSTRYQNRVTDNAISSFPFLTPQTANAVPDRLNRDGLGNLVSLDARPLNAFQTRQTSLRSGLNLKKRYPKRTGTKWPPDQISLSLFHTWRWEDDFQFRNAGPVFNLLDGAALRRQGSEPKHEIQTRLNFRRKNLGAILSNTYETGTRIDVSSLPGNQGRNGDLNLNALTKADLRLFYDFGRKPNGKKVKRTDWRRDLRVTLDLTNITNSKQFATNDLGDIPFGYEQDAIDPTGRSVMISVRKAIFK